MNPIAGRYNPQIFSQVSMPKADADLMQVGQALAEPFQKTLDAGVAELKAGFGTSAASRGSLADSVKGFVTEVDVMSKRAEGARAAILSGESNNLHQAMIASQEAGVSFSLMVEMRNKLLETYQELMRLQV